MTDSSGDGISQDKGPTILSIIWVLTAISSVFVLARLFVRIYVLQKTGLDDILISASMIIEYIYASIVTVSIHAGYGRHASTLEPHELERAKFFNAVAFAPGILSFCLPKLAVVALLVRIMNPSRSQRIFMWTLVCGTGLAALCCVVILFAQCHPTRALWVDGIQGAKCWNASILVEYSIAVGCLSAAVDLYLAIYPILILVKLHMHRKKKIGLSIAMGLGVFACVMAIVKCSRLPSLYNRSDTTYASADVFIWTDIESNTIIIAACIPTLAPLIELLLGKRALGSTDPYTPVSNERSNRNGSNKKDGSKVELSSRLKNRKDSLGDDEATLTIQRQDDVIVQYEQRHNLSREAW
ncbi:hypothetical protein ASPZODRAFT_13265 [Penicilliopsis zonata CBS 506.65]|uniref:Rhodopsin domain-containing protein n=1 Tax=Penicilliopsis zonata CBS 506.65 TaxID=1073090 RepID=A0A1L9SSS5_9EURO|nr:hypothetical protein ASPZODRAFT_13265 [Penicilliopsis zonata CBS 506.65]OJJ50176.1 hypothetical protein ASPZODRAFT_13265 [Penicilliopsis zonata CBS 506.65]